jgi:hypothetical protein
MRSISRTWELERAEVWWAHLGLFVRKTIAQRARWTEPKLRHRLRTPFFCVVCFDVGPLDEGLFGAKPANELALTEHSFGVAKETSHEIRRAAIPHRIRRQTPLAGELFELRSGEAALYTEAELADA